MSVASCTPPAAATIRWRPICGCGFARRSTASTRGSCRCNERSSGVPSATAIASCRPTPIMQRAQPVLAPHYWLAYCEKFERDRGRLADCRARTNVLSLGAAAVAGTSLPIDRHDVARRAGVRRRGGQQHRRCRAIAISWSSLSSALTHDRRPPEHLGRGVDSVVDQRVQFLTLAAGVLHRLVDHAAKGQSRRAGIDPRQDGPRDRRA